MANTKAEPYFVLIYVTWLQPSAAKQMTPVDCTETSVSNYHYTLCNIPEGRRSNLHLSVRRWIQKGTSAPQPAQSLCFLTCVSSRFRVSAVQVGMFGSAIATNSERNVADEAAAKEREECAQMSFVNCSSTYHHSMKTGDNEFNGRLPVVSNYLSHKHKLFRLTQRLSAIFQHYTFRSKTIISGVFPRFLKSKVKRCFKME